MHNYLPTSVTYGVIVTCLSCGICTLLISLLLPKAIPISLNILMIMCLLSCISCCKGALNLTDEEFHTVVAPTAIVDVACLGTENRLTECSYSTSPTCGLLNDAGVICQGKVVEIN